MKKPEKREVEKAFMRTPLTTMAYNKACDEWEAWLPNEKEIKKFLRNNIETYISSHGSIGEDYSIDFDGLAKAIHKRIRDL